jgi:hypothetical protein
MNAKETIQSQQKEQSHVVPGETVEVYYGDSRTLVQSKCGGFYLHHDLEKLAATRAALMEGIRLIDIFLGGMGS